MPYKNKIDKKIYTRKHYLKNKPVYDRASRSYLTKKIINNYLEAAQYLGGKCAKCGYNKNPFLLCYHHKNNKKNNISYLIRQKKLSFGNKELMKELDKCILLCQMCHQLEHSYMAQGYVENKNPDKILEFTLNKYNSRKRL